MCITWDRDQVKDHDLRPAFEHGAGFLLARLGAIAEREWGAVVRAAGLRRADYAVLVVLEEAERRGEVLTQRQIAERVGVDPRNMVATAARLREEGRIDASTDPGDGRARRIRLTESGRRACGALRRDLERGRTEFFDPLDADEYDTLCELLGRVYAARLHTGPTPRPGQA